MKAARRLIQLGFLGLTLVGVFVVRGHTERWCPFGGVEAAYSYATRGVLTCSLGVANFYILGGVLVMTLLLRRAFCGYACPIGTISELIQGGARRLGLRPLRVPATLDRALGLLKYPVLVIIVYITWRAGELLFRGFDPCYALISRHGKDITIWAYVASGGIVLASLFILVPFCRWLCPLAAVLAPFSRFGLTRVQREAQACIDCGLCARACPMAIPVDKVRTVTAARCTSCLDCLAACPKLGAGALYWGPPRRLGGRWPQAALVVLLLACIAAPVAATGLLPLPSFVHERGTPPAEPASVRLKVSGVTCRGTSEALVQWLERDDEYAVPGYLKVETWPDPNLAAVRITFDPDQTDVAALKRALVLPYYNLLEDEWKRSEFSIDGYSPSLDDL